MLASYELYYKKYGRVTGTQPYFSLFSAGPGFFLFFALQGDTKHESLEAPREITEADTRKK